MKRIFSVLAMAGLLTLASTAARADGCYMCDGNTFVKYSGEDNADKRKAAKACGCQIHGTRGDCSAGNLKILCSVLNETSSTEKLACADSSDEAQSDSLAADFAAEERAN